MGCMLITLTKLQSILDHFKVITKEMSVGLMVIWCLMVITLSWDLDHYEIQKIPNFGSAERWEIPDFWGCTCAVISEKQDVGNLKYEIKVYKTLTLSSFNHFSSNCFLPCCKTGRQSSNDSNLFSCPWSSKIPKYCRRGALCPGWVGTCWNLWIVCGVLKMP